MILIKVYGERTDVCAYLSYYAKAEIKVLTEAKDEEIFFEAIVSGFCHDGDLIEVNQLVVEVVMDKKYEQDASKIADVINYYGTYFTNNVYVYFSLKDDNLAYNYTNQAKKEFDADEKVFIEEEEEHKCCHEGNHEHKDGECGCHGDDKCKCHHHEN